MEIYLPIADMSVQWMVILGVGLGVGFLSANSNLSCSLLVLAVAARLLWGLLVPPSDTDNLAGL